MFKETRGGLECKASKATQAPRVHREFWAILVRQATPAPREHKEIKVSRARQVRRVSVDTLAHRALPD